ncbi:MAG: DUF3568 family protein [Thermodesulfobacteriota bacterium]|nr:DUF3568 family protein [Thermodesulfobacteriota bacterium]
MLKKWGRLAFLLCLAVHLSGCAGAALVAGGLVGAGGVVYVKGRLQEQLHSPLATVHQATLAALKDFELPVREDKKDMLVAKVRSQLANGDPVWIELLSLSEESTQITIRFGVLGNETRSRRLLGKIRGHLIDVGGL